jgi:hypothetical protein
MSTKRPTINDEAVATAAAKSLVPAVNQWLETNGEIGHLPQIEADLIKALKYASDGYEIARKLEPLYDPDAALVEILDGAYSAKIQALTALEREWVTASGIQPIPLGSKVTWAKKPEAGIGIVSENSSDGKSLVRFESLGQVKEGVGSHGYHVNWENLILVETHARA